MKRSVWLILTLMAGLPGVAATPGIAQSDGDAAIELSGFSVSEAFDLNAGDRLDLGDSQFLKLVHRSGKVSAVNFKKWAAFSAEITWPQLVASPHLYRFFTFNRSLMLTRLTQVSFPNSVVAGEIKGVYLAHCETDSGQPVFLVTQSAPRKIVLNQAIRQPISFVGFYYNTVAVKPSGELLQGTDQDAAGEPPGDAQDRDGAGQGGWGVGDPAAGVPLFIANRFAWHPVSSTSKMAVSPGQLELASRGVDVGLFDYVRKQNSKPLSRYDADAFYQILAAAAGDSDSNGQPIQRQNDFPSAAGVDFAELMSAPTRHFGGRISMTGRLRQCVAIKIANQDRQLQVGIDRYYQGSLFPDLGGRDVVVRMADNQSVKFEKFPVTVCFGALPDGFSEQSLEGKSVVVKGYFYRFIKYQSKVSADASLSGQVSPLVVASEIEVVPSVTSGKGVDLFLRSLLLLVLAAVVAGVAWGVLKDRIAARGAVDEAVDALPEKLDVSRFEDQSADPSDQ